MLTVHGPHYSAHRIIGTETEIESINFGHCLNSSFDAELVFMNVGNLAIMEIRTFNFLVNIDVV